MSGALASLRAAFSYFSVLPVAGRERLGAPQAEALVALPVVGAVLGALAGLAASLVARAAPRPLSSAAALTLPIVLSGAIHLDGFLDCSDAVFASVSPQRRLEILKDPAHGTYAAAAMLVLVAWSAAALEIVPAGRLPAVLAYSGALARLAAVMNARGFAYARPRAQTPAFETRPGLAPLALEALVLCAASFRFSRSAWTLVPLSCIAAHLVARFLAARLGGGLVGDAYGFLIVALEPALVTLVALLCRRT